MSSDDFLYEIICLGRASRWYDDDDREGLNVTYGPEYSIKQSITHLFISTKLWTFCVYNKKYVRRVDQFVLNPIEIFR